MRPVLRRGAQRAAYAAFAGLGLVRRGRVPPSTSPQRILVVRLDLLGDVLFTTMAVRALRARYPHARIDMMTLPYTAPLARLYPEIDDVLVVDSNRIRTLRGLLAPSTWREYRRVYRLARSRRYDLAISVAGRTAGVCAALSGSRWTVGFAKEAYPGLVDEMVPGGRYDERMHEVEYVLRLAVAAGAEVVPERLEVPVTGEMRRRGEALLAAAGAAPGVPVVLIHAGSINGSAKRWPPTSWAAFANEVAKRATAHVILVGAPGDQGLADAVLARAPHARSLVGRTSVEDLVAIIAAADLVATGDSGPLHLAVALGRPLLCAYGPTDPAIHGPYHPMAPVVLHRRDLVCSPCYTMANTAECPLGDPVCMSGIPVESMVRSALRLLAPADEPTLERTPASDGAAGCSAEFPQMPAW